MFVLFVVAAAAVVVVVVVYCSIVSTVSTRTVVIKCLNVKALGGFIC